MSNVIFPLSVTERYGITYDTPQTQYLNAFDIRMVAPLTAGSFLLVYEETHLNNELKKILVEESVAQVIAAIIQAGVTVPFVAATDVTYDVDQEYTSALFAQRHIRDVFATNTGSRFSFAVADTSDNRLVLTSLTPAELQATAQPGNLQFTSFNTVNGDADYTVAALVGKEVLWVQYGIQTLPTADYTFDDTTGEITFNFSVVGVVPVYVIYQNPVIP